MKNSKLIGETNGTVHNRLSLGYLLDNEKSSSSGKRFDQKEKVSVMKFPMPFVLIFLILWPLCGLTDNTGSHPTRNVQPQERNEVFFPIGIFSANPPDALKELKDIGFNTVQTYRISSVKELNTYLKAVKANGLKALVYPGMRIDIKQQSTDTYSKMLNEMWPQILNESSVLAWYLADEPEHLKVLPEQIKAFENEIKALDALHPTALATGPNYYQKYKDIGDVLIVDPYPIPISPVSEVSDTLEKAKKVVGSSKPIWAVIQAYDRGLVEAKVRSMKLKRDTTPTFEEINCMTYLAIVHGAKGIFFYTFNETGYKIKDHPALWNDIQKIVAGLNRRYQILISMDGVGLNTVVSSAKSGMTPKNIHYLFKKNGMDTFLLAVNSKEATEEVTFGSLLFKNGKLTVIDENRDVSVMNGSVTDTFKPYEVHIYRFER
jgi:hypothetical protein